jgi:hypothetical protein
LDQSARVDSLLIDGLAALGERRGRACEIAEKALCALDFRLRIDEKARCSRFAPACVEGPEINWR